MGKLDWGFKFSLGMTQNRGEGKKVHPVERKSFSFWPISPLFWWNWSKGNEMFFKNVFFKLQLL